MRTQRRDRPLSGEQAIAVAAARLLPDRAVCFVGVGLPSMAALLARRTRAPGLFLVYESGVLGADPSRPPLSVADHALADSARALVSVPEIFNYWLQGGRIDVGLLGAAQVDRFANVNSTVVGDSYGSPRVRLPGAGGAPEIVGAARTVVVMMRQTLRSFVEAVDFITTVGHGAGPASRDGLGLRGGGPSAVVTDIGLYEPDAESRELTLTRLQPGRTVDEARAATGWELAVAGDLGWIEPPTPAELEALRHLDGAGP